MGKIIKGIAKVCLGIGLLGVVAFIVLVLYLVIKAFI
jgi:preprotein translocase subunit Sss1